MIGCNVRSTARAAGLGLFPVEVTGPTIVTINRRSGGIGPDERCFDTMDV